MERDRLLWLFFDCNSGLLTPRLRMLHVAPERPLRARLERLAGEYVSGDLQGEFGPLRVDVTSLPFPDDSFDALICNHVLEHVQDDQRAMCELRRVLRPGGWAILLVPDVAADLTHEDPGVVDRVARRRLFGQEDHVRRYGWDYLDRLRAAGFQPEVIDMGGCLPALALDQHALLKFGQVEPIFLCR